jgi:hypothetical protein
MTAVAKTARWAAFLPGGFVGGLAVGILAWLPFAAPYLLFHKLPMLAIWGCVASYLAYLYTFLHLSWLISPTKSKVEGWIILLFAGLITADGARGGIATLDHVGAPLFAVILGLIHLFQFYLTACRGKDDRGLLLVFTWFVCLAIAMLVVVLFAITWFTK